MFRTLLMRGWFFTNLLNSILASPNGYETWWSCSWRHYKAIEYLIAHLDMCSILCWILSIWEALGCIFLHFWFDSCIVNKGEQFQHVLGCCMLLGGYQVVSSYFWARVVPRWSLAWPVSSTGLTGVSSHVLGNLAHHPDQWGWPVRAKLRQLLCLCCGLHAFV
jgi:hypothetical protein